MGCAKEEEACTAGSPNIVGPFVQTALLLQLQVHGLVPLTDVILFKHNKL